MSSENPGSTLETFADAVINDPAILSKTHSYPLNQQAHGFRKYGEYRIFLNGSPAGLLSKNNPQMMIRTKKVKNVLCAVDNSSGEKDFLFFEVVRAPERKIGFTLLGKLVCVDEKKAGITILQPA
ncbi:hypothetical protein LJC22_06045 [Desulfosarcina sp. OttesenSCG-928-G10]|nr:hypothetical protein [Desulfosarcina sp. OttesenSCG-928-G10]MDL2322068.1 hypothetical protein [Desulfosarcina sp. OttesenSCG-928-B08]